MISEEVRIREVLFTEVELLQQITRDTFIKAFGHLNKASDMQLYMDKAFALQQIQLEFDDPNSYHFFVENQTEVMGFIKLNLGPAQSEMPFNNAMEIQRIYVIAKFQGVRIGEQLLKFTINFAKQMKMDKVWLGVWDKNTRAISFYEKNGFVAFSKHEFMVGTDQQFDIMMQLDISEWQRINY
jgi:ribosomal protein S18 acetylase RimI-like enzyme